MGIAPLLPRFWQYKRFSITIGRRGKLPRGPMHYGVQEQAPLIAVASSTELLGPNPRRAGIILSAGPTNRYSISFASAAVLDRGLTVYPGSAPVVLIGDWCACWMQRPINAISAVADQNVSVVEILAAGPDRKPG